MNEYAMKQGFFCHSQIAGRISLAFACSVGLMLGVVPAHGQAQMQDLPTAMKSPNAIPLGSIATKSMAALDLHAIALEDQANQSLDKPPRFAIPNLVNLTPNNSGSWEVVDADTLMWRLRITCPNAVSINFGFTHYTMPAGGQLYLYSADQTKILRSYTADDNRDYKQLWTPPVVSNDVIVEVTVPTAKRRQLDLVLGSINLGYYDFSAEARGDDGGIAATGGCEIDVLCSQGDNWRNEIPAVALITVQGSSLCTGWMTGNTANDKRNYFMTANHCGLTSGNAFTLVTYWNFFNSTCRTPIGACDACVPAGNGSLSQNISGSTFRAGFVDSDFTLVELPQSPPASWHVSYAGWNRADANSPNGAGIHHPDGEEKRISLYTSSTFITNWNGGPANTHLGLVWNQGVTEPGSSGSPLFDTNKRVIGQLHGGSSACTNPFGSDVYGRFFRSWTGGGTSSTRLSDWLDPVNTGQITLDTISGLVPSNDSCATSLLVFNGSTSVTNINASTDGPDEPGGCNFNGYTQLGNDVWYRWLAPCTGTATVSLCGATFNAKLAIYVGCPAGSGNVIACNDDFCGTSPQVSFPCTQNTLYRFRVGGFNGATGTATMVVGCPPPPNDNCTSSTLVFAGNTAVTNVNATTDGPDEPAGCNFGGYTQIGNDVWYRWLAPCTGTATVSLCGATFNAKVGIYIGCPSGSGNVIACNDDFCGTSPQVSFAATQNTLYRIRVGGFNGAQGTATMALSCTAPPACPADVTHDNLINIDDLVAVITAWGACPGCAADVTGNGVVDIDDLVAVITAWGACP